MGWDPQNPQTPTPPANSTATPGKKSTGGMQGGRVGLFLIHSEFGVTGGAQIPHSQVFAKKITPNPPTLAWLGLPHRGAQSHHLNPRNRGWGAEKAEKTPWRGHWWRLGG